MAAASFQLPPLGARVRGELGAGEVHGYLVQLTAGDFMLALVRQRGVDVAISIIDPAGRLMAEVDYPSGSRGTERVALVAATSGVHRLLVHPLKGSAGGQYDLSLAERRVATARDRERAYAALLFAAAEEKRSDLRAETQDAVVDLYRRAAKLDHDCGARWEEGVALYRLGQALGASSHPREAFDALRQALALFKSLRDRQQVAGIYAAMGQVWQRTGWLREARWADERELEAARASGDRDQEAGAWNDLALVEQAQGELDKALAGYGRALMEYRRGGQRGGQVTALHNLGAVCLELNRFEEARDYLLQSLALQQRLGSAVSSGQRSLTLTVLGQVHSYEGEPLAAVSYYLRGMALARRAGDRWAQANLLDKLGTAWLALGRAEDALGTHQRAAWAFRELGDRGRLGWVLSNLGKVHERQGRRKLARFWYRQSLMLFVGAEDRAGEAYVSLAEARIARREGDLEGARRHLERALARIESLRADAPGPALRSSFLASRQVYYESYVDLLMELHRRHPRDGWDGRALEANERGRARSFLDTLGEAEAARRGRTQLGLVARERQLLDRVEGLEAERMAGSRRAGIARELRDLLLEREALLAQARGHERGAPPARPAPLSVDEMRKRVLDSDSLLLVYSLGQERSFLWLLDRGSLRSFVLPGSGEIEALARATGELLSRGETTSAQGRLVLSRLGAAVLGPARAFLGTARLLVVADGALRSVPFVALPEDRQGTPVLVDHEVVYLDSASALAFQRQRLSRRAAAPRALAVVADPVFGPEDGRLMAAAGKPRVAPLTADLRRSAADLGLQGFERLPEAGREAAAILSLVPERERLAAVGLGASRELVASGALSGYRIVHFATHGLIHPRHLELSGLVLSLVDARGRPRDGFLRSYELGELRLRADLVVLSACRTALGQEIRGEGMVGMGRSLMAAGAPRVVASLWSVLDRSTAELMSRFYRRLLCDGLRPAAALRQAQLSMLGEAEWRDPRQWAAFVFEGDWREARRPNKVAASVSMTSAGPCRALRQAKEE